MEGFKASPILRQWLQIGLIYIPKDTKQIYPGKALT